MITEVSQNKLFSRLLVTSFLIILLDGIFRKWLLPSLSSQIFALKYLFFGLTYLVCFYQSGYSISKVKYPFQVFLIIFLLWMGYQFFFHNPLNAPLIVYLAGTLNYLFFMPLIIVVPIYFNSINRFLGMIRFLGIISIPIFVLGIIQYFLPPDHILNSFVNEEQKITLVTQYTRVISIFTFVKIYNVFLLFTSILFFTFIFIYQIRKKSPYFLYFIIILGLLNTIMTASRLPTFLTVFFFLIIVIYILINIPLLRNKTYSLLIVGLIALIALYFNSNTYKTAVDAFLTRTENAEIVADRGVAGYSATDRLISRLMIFSKSEEAGFFGYGIGVTYQGTGEYILSKIPSAEYEDENHRIVLEIGTIGILIIFLIRISVFLHCFKLFLRIRKLEYTLLFFPLILYILPPTFFISNVTFNYLESFTYWFAIGLMISLEKIYLKSYN